MRTHTRVIAIVLTSGLAVAGLAIAFSVFNPTPPRTVVMATGPAGSAYAQFAEQYRHIFAANNIELELRDSAGAYENLSLLQSGEVDVAFITMGSTDSTRSPEIFSLGAMFYEPMWVFYRKSVLAQENLLAIAGNKVSIGPTGSRTNIASRDFFSLVGVDADRLELLPLDPQEAALALREDRIDAAIMVSSVSTPVVKELLGSETVGLANFRRAAAYAALYPFLTRLTVPAGVGDLIKDVPKEDVNIMAFTAILAVHENLHPAIQALLIEAASQIHAVPDLFHTDGHFPSQRIFKVPLSSSASRYYSNGLPFLQRYLPFWLAVFVKQTVVAILPLIGIVYPAARAMPSLFAWMMRRRINRVYGQLRNIEVELMQAEDESERDQLIDKLDSLDSAVRRFRMPVTYSSLAYTLRSHIRIVRSRYEESPPGHEEEPSPV